MERAAARADLVSALLSHFEPFPPRCPVAGARRHLEVLDIQQEMLDHTVRRAHALGISNIVPRQGDAQALPYPNGHFDAAYLVATLGEVPDKERALRELRRVLKPGGRLVIGEGQPDPHMVSLDKLRMLADATGLTYEGRIGGSLGYFASFRAP